MSMMSSGSFQKGQEDIADKLLRRHFWAGAAIVLLAAVMETGLFFWEAGRGLIAGRTAEYLRKAVFCPTGLNILALVAVAVFLRHTGNKKARAYAVSLMHTFFAFVVCVAHNQFPSLYIVFAISLLLTVAYGDVAMTSVVAAACIALKVVSDIYIPSGFSFFDRVSVVRFEMQEYIVSLAGLAVFYLLCLVVIAIEREKNALAVQQERENVQLFQRIMTDSLTGVRNRNALRVSFDRVMADESGTEYILAMLDIDYFKNVNDTYGHLVGDEYLKALGKVLEHVPDAEAFRFGGDEFCLLFTGCSRAQVEERCRAAQEKYLRGELCKKYAQVNVSFGLAGYDHKATPSEWIQYADEALYEAKKNRGSICYYEPEE